MYAFGAPFLHQSHLRTGVGYRIVYFSQGFVRASL